MRLIDADALTMEVESSQHNNPHTNGRVRQNHFNEHQHFMRMILWAPTVEAVTVVHGRWEEIRGAIGNYECSLCGCIPYYAGNIHTLNYCPKCGAKMDGGEG